MFSNIPACGKICSEIKNASHRRSFRFVPDMPRSDRVPPALEAAVIKRRRHVMSDDNNQSSYIELAADIVSAYVSNNSVPASDLASLISDVHSALVRVTSGIAPVSVEALKPAVPAKKSVT